MSYDSYDVICNYTININQQGLIWVSLFGYGSKHWSGTPFLDTKVADQWMFTARSGIRA